MAFDQKAINRLKGYVHEGLFDAKSLASKGIDSNGRLACFFWDWRRSWSRAQFGDRGPIGPLKHLAKEAVEAIEKPGDIEEYADILHLLCDAADRAGFDLYQLLHAAMRKLEKNIMRQWPETVGDEPTEHIKN